jgi:hypothetical protein
MVVTRDTVRDANIVDGSQHGTVGASLLPGGSMLSLLNTPLSCGVAANRRDIHHPAAGLTVIPNYTGTNCFMNAMM